MLIYNHTHMYIYIYMYTYALIDDMPEKNETKKLKCPNVGFF